MRILISRPISLIALLAIMTGAGAPGPFLATLHAAEGPAAIEASSEGAAALQLPQDRQIDQWLVAARKSLDSGEFGAAVVMLQRILNSDLDSFVVADGSSTLVSARQQAAELISRLPAESRTRFEVELDRIAAEAFASIRRDGSIDSIAMFAQRHKFSQSGLEALLSLAAMCRDAGRHQQSAIAWQAVAKHPRASRVLQVCANVAYVDSLLLAGLVDAAEVAMREPGRFAPGATAVIGGQKVDARDWIERRLRDVRAAVASQDPSGTELHSVARPGLKPVWSRDTATVAELQKSVSLIQKYFREQAVVSSNAIRPMMAGNLVVTRTMQELVAFDIGTGETVWSVPNHEYAWIQKRPAFLENSPFRTATAGAWHRRTEADSIFGAVSTNGKLIVVVQEPDRSNLEFPVSNGQGRGGAQPIASTRWNRLCGYEIATRELRWQVGGSPTGPADLFGGISFLSAPLFVDDLLFVIVRREDELSLMAMDSGTGHLRWSIKLGILPPHLADSVSRRRIACPVILSDGLLLCATANGMVLAVNPTSRSIEWAYRYPVVQHDLPIRMGNGVQTAALPDVWWNEWREVNFVLAKPGNRSVAFVASPDSDQLHALDVSNGRGLWSVGRGGALHLAGATDDTVILIEPMGARAHDLRTGELKWRAVTGEISGRGIVVGTQLFQPKRTGGIAVINLDGGAQQAGLISSDTVYTSLVPGPQGWIAQTDQSIQRLPFLDSVRRDAEARWESQRTEANSIELARIDLQSGDPTAARRHLLEVPSPMARSLRRDAILAILHQDGTELSRSKPAVSSDAAARSLRVELGRELLELSETPDERLIAMRALGDAAVAGQDYAGALTYYLDGLDLIDAVGLRAIGDMPADAISARPVRADRILLGAIQRVLAVANQSEGSSDSSPGNVLNGLMNDRLELACRSEDPFAVQRLLDRLLPLDWGRQAFLANSAAVMYARPLQKVEPMLLSIAGSRNPVTSVTAIEQLIDLQTRSGWRSSSEILQRRILVDLPGIPLSGGKTLAVALAADPSQSDLRNRLLAPLPDPWPSGLPLVEREAKRQDVYRVPVRVQTSANSLLSRLDVSIDRQGRRVRFVSEGHSGAWEVQLPGPPKTLRTQFANLDQVEAHAVGRLLVLRVGSEVFGVLPFNERGEPPAVVTALQFDMAPSSNELPNEAWWYQEAVPARVGIRLEGSRLVDGLGRPFGGLGPVRPGYLCYRSQARLIAVDTQTGRRLWERSDMPPNCQILGDDDCVYVWRIEERSMQVLSVVDGHLLAERPWHVSSDDVLMHHGSRVWSVNRKPVVTVELTDARTGTIQWSRQFAPNSIPFSMDQTAVGVLEPGGVLHVLAAESGAPFGEPLTVEFPDRVERIVCLHDAQRWYVAISGPVPRLPNLQGDQPWGGTRAAFVHGWLYGIDRRSVGIAWRRFLDSEPLPLHESRVVPLLVQMWRRSATEGNTGNMAQGILRLIDKRTGSEILTHRETNLQPYFFLIPTENHEKLEIVTEHETLRLNYRSSR